MYTQAIETSWVGRDSNPEPTPKAFGAALTIRRTARSKSQVVDSFFVLESALIFALLPLMELPSQRQVRSAAEAMRCVIAATFMLRRAALEIIGRADVIS